MSLGRYSEFSFILVEKRSHKSLMWKGMALAVQIRQICHMLARWVAKKEQSVLWGWRWGSCRLRPTPKPFSKLL